MYLCKFSIRRPSSKIILIGLWFLGGFILGYLLGFLKIHKLIFINLSSFSLNFAYFLNITPNPTFLSDIAAFEAAIIAFLVPLSIEIISKISERYNSDVITRIFEKKWENRVLAPFLLINIAAAIGLRFLVPDNINSLKWKIVAWATLFCLLFIAWLIYRIINHIKKFMSNTEFVLTQLYQDVEKTLE